MSNFEIRPALEHDRQWIEDLLHKVRLSTQIVSRGQVYDASALPGFIAVEGDNRLGFITFRIEAGECEIITINSFLEGMGIGTELLKTVIAEAVKQACRRVFLITTNDNTDALRFYQTRGFILKALHQNAVERSRELKPEIPSRGVHDIPIRDEIELEMNLI